MSSSSFEQDSGSEYIPNEDTNLSINSSLLQEMDSNGSDILEQQNLNKLKEIDDPNLPITSHKSETVQLPITYDSDNLQLPISDQTSVPFITWSFNFDGIVETS